MIRIVAENFVDRDFLEDFKKAAEELVAESQMEEGNILYTLNVDVNDPGHMTFIEFWEDQDAIDYHNKTAHFTSIVPKLHDYCYKPGIVHLYKSL